MRKLLHTLGLVAVTATLLGATVTPELKQSEEDQLAQDAKDFNDVCATKIPVTVDWKSFGGVDVEDHSIHSFCAEPIKTLMSICDNSETKKKKIQAQIKTVSCTYAGKATEKDQLKEPEVKDVRLTSGKLVWRFNWNASNVNDYMIEQFKKLL